jgi:hypothetical protein
MSAREQLGRAETYGNDASAFAGAPRYPGPNYCKDAEKSVRIARDAYAKAVKSISQAKGVKTRRIISVG